MLNDACIAEKIGLQKKCGFWQVNGLFFFDKIECMKYATIVKNDHISYHYFDSAYTNLDWSTEPSQDMKELYKLRAQQIRDTYDYIVLSFSGGSDSTNVLKTFIDNNIKVDEVFCEYPLEIIEKEIKNFTADRNDPKQIMFEWFAAKPILESISKTNPEIKITIESSAQDSLKMIDECKIFEQQRGGIIISAHARYNRLYQVVKNRTKFGKVGCISGVDKPRIFYHPQQNKFYSHFHDTNNLTHFPSIAYAEMKDDLVIDHFYITPDFPQLNQKQCFVVKHALEKLMKNKDTTLYDSLLYKVNPHGYHIYDMHHDFFKTTLYDFWSNTLYQAEKSANFFYPPPVIWIDKYTSDRSKNFLDKQISELLFGIDKKFLLFENGKPASLKHIFTKPISF
jgi:hypothetical protein